MPTAGGGGRTRFAADEVAAAAMISLAAAFKAGRAPLAIVSIAGEVAASVTRLPEVAPPPELAPPPVVAPPAAPPLGVLIEVLVPKVVLAELVAVVLPEPLISAAMAVMPTLGTVEAATPALLKPPAV